jgi:hypothetical protein
MASLSVDSPPMPLSWSYMIYGDDDSRGGLGSTLAVD